MKKSFIRFSALLLILLFSVGLKAQSIRIVSSSAFGSSSPANPVSVCQCDTLGVSTNPSNGVTKPELRYNISAPSFGSGVKFYYEFANPNNAWTGPGADSLELFSLTGANDGPLTDTGFAEPKEAQLIIPCDAPLGAGTIRIRSSNGVFSDTAFVLINKLPAEPVIKQIVGGFPNPYTTTLNDWGFCPGDSITLVAEQQAGASYQWLNSGAPIPGETDTILKIGAGGSYALRIDLGACARDSKDTIINISQIPTNIQNNSSPPTVIQIDNPNPFGFPRDSVRFCEGNGAALQANGPPMGTGLTFSYQWITDSVDAFSNTVYYMTDSADTLQTFFADTTGRFYVVIDDGFCLDTSDAYYAFMDTTPTTQIASEIFENGLIQPIDTVVDICMRDSVRLSSTNTGTSWTYQWQRLQTSTNTWQTITGATNPTLVVDTSIKPIRALSFYRLRTRTTTFYTGATVCEFFSPQVRIRWRPKDSINYTPRPWITQVGNDSVSLCETDSVQLFGPTTPAQLDSNGLSYSYQWLTDSIDTLGVVHRVPITGASNRTFYTNMGGQYFLEIYDGICTDTFPAFNVFVDTVPRVTVRDTGSSGNGRLLCVTDTVVLYGDPIPMAPPLGYQWQRYSNSTGAWINITGANLPGIVVDTALRLPGEDTVYFRVQTSYTNQFGLPGCPFTSDSVEVVFYDLPTINFFPGDSLGICAGDSVRIEAIGNSLSYQWSTGAITPSVTISQPGTYTVTGTGVNGCTSTADVVVYSIATTANAGPDVTTTSGTDVFLSGSGGTDYRWYASKPIAWSDFLSQNVTVSYTLPDGVKSDTITIYLQVTNGLGCRDLDSLQLIVSTDEDPIVTRAERTYNYFTPNGDRLNQVWDITAIVGEYTSCRIDIMNRWGSIVYNQEEFDGIWDGRNNGGEELPDGTYYYILSCDGEVILKNAVTLIRTK